jgi:hypothetical protein
MASSSPCQTRQQPAAMATMTSPATKKAHKKTLEAVIMRAARDVIELKKVKKMYRASKDTHC